MNDELPLITIGMPVFNGEQLIDQAIESLLSQTYTNFELIISDNNSTDSTFSICQKYSLRDKRIILTKQYQNIGPLKNFEYVLKSARGQYFMWAAHDDVWHENWLSNALSGFKTTDVVMVTSSIVGVNDMNKPISKPLKFKFDNKGFINRIAGYFLLPEWLGKANLIYSLIKTDVANQYNFPNSEGFYGFDMHFVFFLLNCGRCNYVQGVALYKRVPKVTYTPYSLYHVENLFGLIKRNLKYFFHYVNLTQNLIGKLVIISLMPLKLVGFVYYIFLSILRRFSSRLT